MRLETVLEGVPLPLGGKLRPSPLLLFFVLVDQVAMVGKGESPPTRATTCSIGLDIHDYNTRMCGLCSMWPMVLGPCGT